MCPETPLAFESLDARASAVAGADPLDRISLRDHVVEVEIGAFQTERGATQRVSFDVVVEVTGRKAPLDDDVDRILSYDTITEAIAYELGAERLNLLETLAERIGERILAEPLAQRVFVRIQKLDRGPGALGVEIVRSRSDVEVQDLPDENAPQPLVVFLSNAAALGPNLSAWIDQLTAQPDPVVLCVGPPDIAAPRSDVSLAQRRIDLLAVEQNAWVLAGRDPRCVVVDSKTELEWATRQGKLSVWGPSRIVLDGLDAPIGEIGDATGISGWFAKLIGAKRMIFLGAGAPDDCAVPFQIVSPDAKMVL